MDSNPVLRQIKLPAGENGVMQPEKYASYVTSKVSVPNGFCNLVSVEAQEDPEKYRFQVELEFVQCLANPQYLNCKCTGSLGVF